MEFDRPEVKICKFLLGFNCLVSADMDGYLNFYAVFPSPLKGQLLTRTIYYNTKEQIQKRTEETEEGETQPSMI